ncbi:MAG: tetratricopeptide repeat protein, partial [Planctomycetota bacterium]
LLDAIAIGSRAMTRLARGDFAGAIADFETASTVAPDSWRPLAGLAAAHAEAGNMEKARKAMNDASARVPADEREEFDDMRAQVFDDAQ